MPMRRGSVPKDLAKFCAFCGSPNADPDLQFCVKCGKRRVTEAEKQQMKKEGNAAKPTVKAGKHTKVSKF